MSEETTQGRKRNRNVEPTAEQKNAAKNHVAESQDFLNEVEARQKAAAEAKEATAPVAEVTAPVAEATAPVAEVKTPEGIDFAAKLAEKQAAAAPALVFEKETSFIFDFKKWVIGEAVSCRLAGFLCHKTDTLRLPGFEYFESDNCEDRGQLKQYYVLELLDEKYNPTGAYIASNKYWHLEQYFVDKITTTGPELTRYAMQITLVNEVTKKGSDKPLKIFEILKATTATLPFPKF